VFERYDASCQAGDTQVAALMVPREGRGVPARQPADERNLARGGLRHRPDAGTGVEPAEHAVGAVLIGFSASNLPHVPAR
jgi:hypothetical protein